jgi:hypothetical protein
MPAFSRTLQLEITEAAALHPGQDRAAVHPDADRHAERAQAMTCSGCHLYSSGANLGGGLVFPQSLAFTHTSESQARMESSPDGGLRFLISPALQTRLLPHRERILKAFLGLP